MASITDKMLQMGDGTPGGSERVVLPRAFLNWQRDSRLAFIETVTSGGAGEVRAMPSHLPVLASRGPDGAINLATKGIGILPKADLLEGFTSLFRTTVKACEGVDWGITIERRARALMTLFLDVSNVDDSRLGGLEIFEGTTYDNLRADPRASLLFTGQAPDFISYQIDGHVEFVEKGDPHYEYLLSARELFAKDGFHVLQTSYPHGFVFHVRNVVDKRPFTRHGGHV